MVRKVFNDETIKLNLSLQEDDYLWIFCRVFCIPGSVNAWNGQKVFNDEAINLNISLHEDYYLLISCVSGSLNAWKSSAWLEGLQ